MTDHPRAAPGGPGLDARWTSSAKAGIGTAPGARSMVWYTLGHGIVNEVYYPRVDQANVRDMGLIVTADPDFFSEEKKDTATTLEMIEPGAPGFRVTNTCRHERFRITKTVLADPDRDVLLQAIDFTALRGAPGDYRLYVLLAPHIGNQGNGNSGWSGDYKGVPMLFAVRGNTALALACSTTFLACSCGFVGVNDGWQQLSRNRRLINCYDSASGGNIALTGEIDMRTGKGAVLALAFGRDPEEAGHAARAALLADFDDVRASFARGWRDFHATSRRLSAAEHVAEESRLSVAVLQTLEDKVRRGAFIASLSIPWGEDRGDHDLGGYHVVWPRDLVEIAGGLLAVGHEDAAQHALHYLMTTQEADGHWPQNMWLDGHAYWQGTQLDETAFPVLLADVLRRRRALGHLDPWPMVRRAASYLVRNGPVTQEDRWEEDGGYSTFTLAVEIAALLAAADFADARGADDAARYMRDTADVWNASLERWTYVTNTDLARRIGVPGYYVRIAPSDVGDGESVIPLRNHDGKSSQAEYSGVVSPDALALVRFGLRGPHDERVRNTLRVIDQLLCTNTPNGPVWHRYNDDGYGERDDGSPFDGVGIGRGWPLLAGERGHYELAAGDRERAKYMLDVMRRQAGLGGLIPEQVWDTHDIPERGLFAGCPTGSAMPLAWAHAEYLKLARSLHDGHVFDMPPQTAKRYVESPQACSLATWRFNNKIREMEARRTLRVEVQSPAVVHWSHDDWRSVQDVHTADTTLGVHIADLPTSNLPVGGAVHFTLYWPDADRWEGTDYTVCVAEAR